MRIIIVQFTQCTDQDISNTCIPAKVISRAHMVLRTIRIASKSKRSPNLELLGSLCIYNMDYQSEKSQ